jgi:hypothetical protein
MTVGAKDDGRGSPLAWFRSHRLHVARAPIASNKLVCDAFDQHPIARRARQLGDAFKGRTGYLAQLVDLRFGQFVSGRGRLRIGRGRLLAR